MTVIGIAAIAALTGCSGSAEDRAEQTAYNFARASTGISDARVADFLCEEGSFSEPEPDANRWDVEVDSTMKIEDGTWEVKLTTTLLSETNRPQYPATVIVSEDGSCVVSVVGE